MLIHSSEPRRFRNFQELGARKEGALGSEVNKNVDVPVGSGNVDSVQRRLWKQRMRCSPGIKIQEARQ